MTRPFESATHSGRRHRRYSSAASDSGTPRPRETCVTNRRYRTVACGRAPQTRNRHVLFVRSEDLWYEALIPCIVCMRVPRSRRVVSDVARARAGHGQSVDRRVSPGGGARRTRLSRGDPDQRSAPVRSRRHLFATLVVRYTQSPRPQTRRPLCARHRSPFD
jgi:hypothetical protein